jgi:hypothetical protein
MIPIYLLEYGHIHLESKNGQIQIGEYHSTGGQNENF